MKKYFWPIMATIFLLAACQSNETKTSNEKKSTKKPEQTVEQKTTSTFPYPNLLAENDHSYSLLVIGEKADQAPIEENKKIINNVKNILSLPTRKMAETAYPKLQIDSKAAYILFDQKGVVQQANSLNDLTNFLQETPKN